jgi:hypothetical protein
MNSRRNRVTALLVLAVLACAPGGLFAEHGARHSCCRPDTVLTIGAASCCPTLQTARPEAAPRAIAPPAPFVLAAATPIELTEEVVAQPAPETVSGPPPLHEGIGLYTLHAAFLI